MAVRPVGEQVEEGSAIQKQVIIQQRNCACHALYIDSQLVLEVDNAERREEE